jgi:hypothetical protein
MPRTGKWSLKYDCCVNCGGNEAKHIARGLCLNCYQSEAEKRNRGVQGLKKGLASYKLNRKYLYEEYVNKGRSLGDIAKDCNCARQFVYKKMQDFNIPLRTLREARKLVLDRQKIAFKIVDEDGNERLVIPGSVKINEDFFRHWSNEMAYVLGVIYTDGHINPGRKLDPSQKTTTMSPRLVISQKQPELLSKVSKLMNCNMKLRYKKKRGVAGALYVFDICSEKIYEDLINFGLSPQKSKTIEFPNIPKEFVRHFIRGCWDGDGSIFFDQNRLVGSYISGSEKFIESLVQELYGVGIYRIGRKQRGVFHRDFDEDKLWLKYIDGRFPLKIHKDKRANAFYIKIQTGENVEKLFHYLYDGVAESMYLTRKYNVFVKGLNLEKKEETVQLTLNLDF